MQPGMSGLGRMGASRVQRPIRTCHDCVENDAHADVVQQLIAEDARGTTSSPDFVQMLWKPLAVRSVLPAAAVDPIPQVLMLLLELGDNVIEGRNPEHHGDAIAGPLRQDTGLANFHLHVSDACEGRWPLHAAIDEPLAVTSAAPCARFEPHGNADYADHRLSAMRFAFDGHVEALA